MKRVVVLYFCFCSHAFFGQTFVVIPDANFASYLQGLIPAAMNGNSLDISSFRSAGFAILRNKTNLMDL